ncbi:MAG: hypothetical protein IPL79_11145 [Myxococcales bacterium]|nr:hypothetical protein [Myxococcales bacterium]
MTEATEPCPACSTPNVVGAAMCKECEISLRGEAPKAAFAAPMVIGEVGAPPPWQAALGETLLEGAPSKAAVAASTDHMSLRRAVALTASAWAANAPFVIATALLFYLPLYLYLYASDMTDLSAIDPENTSAQVNRIIYQLVVNFCLAAVVAYAVFQALSAKPASFVMAVRYGVARALPALGTTMAVVILIGIGSLIWLGLPAVFGTCILYVAVPARVIERAGIHRSLARSRDLTSGSLVQIFLLIVILLLVHFGVAYVLRNTVTSYLQARAESATEVASFLAVVNVGSAIDLVFASISASFFAVSTSVVYFLLCKSKEGTNADELAAVFQ